MAAGLGKSRQVGHDRKSWNAGLLTAELGKSRQVGPRQEIPECKLLAAGLGKSRQVGRDRKSWNAGYWQLGWASLGKWAGDQES